MITRSTSVENIRKNSFLRSFMPSLNGDLKVSVSFFPHMSEWEMGGSRVRAWALKCRFCVKLGALLLAESP